MKRDLKIAAIAALFYAPFLWLFFTLGQSSILRNIEVRAMHWPPRDGGFTYYGTCAWSGEAERSPMFCAKLRGDPK